MNKLILFSIGLGFLMGSSAVIASEKKHVLGKGVEAHHAHKAHVVKSAKGSHVVPMKVHKKEKMHDKAHATKKAKKHDEGKKVKKAKKHKHVKKHKHEKH